MRPSYAFRPYYGAEATVSIAPTAVSSRVALSGAASTEYLLTNTSSVAVFFSFGDSTIAATVPNGATGGSTPLAAGSVQVFRTRLGTAPTNFAAITASGTASTIYITPGEGF